MKIYKFAFGFFSIFLILFDISNFCFCQAWPVSLLATKSDTQDEQEKEKSSPNANKFGIKIARQNKKKLKVAFQINIRTRPRRNVVWPIKWFNAFLQQQQHSGSVQLWLGQFSPSGTDMPSNGRLLFSISGGWEGLGKAREGSFGYLGLKLKCLKKHWETKRKISNSWRKLVVDFEFVLYLKKWYFWFFFPALTTRKSNFFQCGKRLRETLIISFFWGRSKIAIEIIFFVLHSGDCFVQIFGWVCEGFLALVLRVERKKRQESYWLCENATWYLWVVGSLLRRLI